MLPAIGPERPPVPFLEIPVPDDRSLLLEALPAAESPDPTLPPRPSVLHPFRLRTIDLRNRAVVAPMTRVSASPEGVPTDRMAAYYAAFAAGGFGLVIGEGTYTDDRFSRAYDRQPGLATSAQAVGWRRVTEAVGRHGAPMIAQLMHAGALSQALERTIAPSAVLPQGKKMPEYGGSGPFPPPAAMTDRDIAAALDGFAAAARNARAAGFAGVELHAANGYLLDQFVTRDTNRRTDRYGGATADRARLVAEAVRAVRAAIGPDAVVGVRLSQTKVNDHAYRWDGRAEAAVLFAIVAEAGPDYLHLASEGRDWFETTTIADGTTLTGLARQVTGLPVIANGGLHEPERAESVVRGGHADLIAIGRGALANPDWPARLGDGRRLAPFDHGLLHPCASLDNADGRGWAASGSTSR
jgi:2,4-dienoyl-CoA reductase-like NADH-dependent reductase (Old Yellow Enzyme family)